MAELGRAAMWIALLSAVGAAASPVVGRSRRAPRLLALSAAAAVTATAVLARALVVGDYSLVYVADFGRRGAGTAYRLAGLWGGMAGSLLWLATLAALAGLAGASRVVDERRRGPTAAVAGGFVAVLVGLVVAFADPFATLDVPAVDGAGLTPILEHRAMLYHPPLLYLGLATLVAPFALTVVALVDGRLDDAWLGTVRRWSLVPWALLGVGMVAGAHWAYVELGWGGYWAWDPVENTALLPWLAITVFLHAARGARLRRPPVSRVTVAGLACAPFVLALLGSLLTRSGATSSVHAFAEARAIGRALAVVVAATAVAVAALLRRAPRPSASASVGAGVVGRLIAAHLAVVGAALAIVLAGTLWPLWADLRGGDGIAVEGRYFAQFLGPLATAGLALICLVPLLVGLAGRAQRPVVLAAAAAGGGGAVAVLVVCAPALAAAQAVLGAAAGAGAATAAGGAVLARRRGSPVGGHLAHAALGLAVLGIAGTASGGVDTVSVQPGQSATVLGHEVTYHGVTVADGPVDGSSAVVADVTTGGQRLRPSLVAYPDRGVLLAETSLRSTPAVDVQVALRTARDDGTALLEVGVHPLQLLVWWGGLAIVAAGVVATTEAARRATTGGGAAVERAGADPVRLRGGSRPP